MNGHIVMVFFTVAAGMAAAASFSTATGFGVASRVGAALDLVGRLRRAEAEAASLRDQLRAQRFAARRDPLTGLLNRRGFSELGETLMADPSHPPLTCVIFDLDGFKGINDTLGHAAGDEVLVAIAERFAAFAGDNLVARLGGDEFVGILAHATDARSSPTLTRKLSETLAGPIHITEATVGVTASIGLAQVNGPAQLTGVLRRADRAMYDAKKAGPGPMPRAHPLRSRTEVICWPNEEFTNNNRDVQAIHQPTPDRRSRYRSRAYSTSWRSPVGDPTHADSYRPDAEQP